MDITVQQKNPDNTMDFSTTVKRECFQRFMKCPQLDSTPVAQRSGRAWLRPLLQPRTHQAPAKGAQSGGVPIEKHCL